MTADETAKDASGCGEPGETTATPPPETKVTAPTIDTTGVEAATRGLSAEPAAAAAVVDQDDDAAPTNRKRVWRFVKRWCARNRLALVGLGAALIAATISLCFAEAASSEDEPWGWLLGSLGVALFWTSIVFSFSLAKLRASLVATAGTEAAKIWTPSGSFLTNLAFLAAAVTALLGDKGAFLDALSAKQKLVVIVSIVLFAAVAGSAGLVSQLHTTATGGLTVGGVFAAGFLTLTATVGNLGVLFYVVLELGSEGTPQTEGDPLPLHGVWVLFVMLIVGLAAVASVYTVCQMGLVGKGDANRHPTMA